MPAANSMYVAKAGKVENRRFLLLKKLSDKLTRKCF